MCMCGVAQHCSGSTTATLQLHAHCMVSPVEGLLPIVVEVLHGVSEPDQVHVLEKHVDAPAQHQVDGEGLVPHHVYEHAVQVVHRRLFGHSGVSFVIEAHRSSGLD